MRYGWRARIGHISPAILDTSGEEMRKLLPEGVLHVGLTISEPIQTLGAARKPRRHLRGWSMPGRNWRRKRLMC